MIPTFDFSNVLKFFARGFLLVIRSPILLMSILASFVTLVCFDLREFLSLDIWFSNLISFTIESFPTNDLINAIFYMLNISTFLSLFYLSITIVATILPSILSFFAAYIGFSISFKAAKAFRQTIKDIVT